jgi:AraC-like DNA-binding protein
MQQLLSNSGPEIRGLDEFTHRVSSTFAPMSVEALGTSAEQVRGELLNTSLDRIHLARIGSSGVKVDRRRADIGQIRDAHYLVKFQLSGQGVVSQRGLQAHLRPGDFVVCSSCEPYKLRFAESYRQAVLAIPQQLLQDMYQTPDDFLGQRMAGSAPAHGLLSQFVLSLVQRLDQLDPAIVQRLEANLLDLLITSLHAESGQRAKVLPDSAADEHLRDIKRFVALHLKDTRLSPEFIAEAEGISKRYLHQLFKAEGISVSRYIQQQRLQACARAIANPELTASLTDIALEWGFSDASHFNRSFKAQFKLTPKQYRQQSLAE